MKFLQLLEMAYKVVGTACAGVSLYIAVAKLMKTRASKRKRNVSNDVPK